MKNAEILALSRLGAAAVTAVMIPSDLDESRNTITLSESGKCSQLVPRSSNGRTTVFGTVDVGSIPAWGVRRFSSVGRALGLGPRGRGFKSFNLHHGQIPKRPKGVLCKSIIHWFKSNSGLQV